MPKIAEFVNPIDKLNPTEIGVDAVAQTARRASALFSQVASGKVEAGSIKAQALGQQANALDEMGRARDVEAGMFEQEGSEAASSLRAIGQVAVDYMQHREISLGAPSYAGLNDQAEKEWSDRIKNADPNDPAVADKFKKEWLEPQLQKFKEGFATEGGRDWAEARVDQMRNHFFEKTTADMSSLAAVAVKKNVMDMTNGMSNTALRDPSSVPHLLAGIDASVGALVDTSPNLKGADAARAKIEVTETARNAIVKAGAIGAIHNAANPEATAAAWGAKYPTSINAVELETLTREAKQEQRARRADATNARVLQDLADKRASDAAEKGVLDKMYDPDPKVRAQVTARAVTENTGTNPLSREARERLMTTIERENKPESDKRISEALRSDVSQKIMKGEITSEDQLLYYRNLPQGLNRADHDEVRQQLHDMLTLPPERNAVLQPALDAVKAKLEISIPGLPGKDVQGAQDYASFSRVFLKDYATSIRAGTVKDGDLDMNDPNSKISKAVAQFNTRTLEQKMQDYIKGIGLANVPRR